MKFSLKPATILKGMAMGIAEIIPGVSGGTIAFITGIYEELLHTIKSFDLGLVQRIRKGEFKKAAQHINLPFVINLGGGMAVGIVFGVFAITYLLEHYPEPLWGFFFGLILASALFIGRQFSIKDLFNVIGLVVGFLIAYGITILSPSEGSTSYLFVFFSAMIAISAMLLPGISGSFMLVLMGMYYYILSSVKSILTQFDLASISVIFVFVLGLIAGAMTFSRVFSWLFNKYKEVTLAVLTGFLLGSLNKIWPWRNVETIYIKETGEIQLVTNADMLKSLPADSFKIMSEIQVLPEMYWSTPKTWETLVSLVIGFLIVFVMDRTSAVKV
jgi:putative membrane protein